MLGEGGCHIYYDLYEVNFKLYLSVDERVV